MTQKVYIAGKVTGEDYEETLHKFKEWEILLNDKGYITVNPTKLVPKDTEWKRAMRTCISELMKCDLIFLLPDWTESKGTLIELELAATFGINMLSRAFIIAPGQPVLCASRLSKMIDEMMD